MGFKESIINGIRNISNASGSVKASVCVGILAYIFHFTGILSDRWLQGGTSSNNHQGLWDYCEDSNGYECCATITDHVKEKGTSRPEYIVATIVFIIFGILAATGAVISSCKQLTSDGFSFPPRFGGFTIFYMLAAFCLLITVSVYGGQYQYHDLTKDNNLHVSFALTVVAMFLYIIAVVLITCC